MKNKDIQFKSIVEENSERIRRICRYYNSNSEDQKDMYQEVLVNIWKSLDRFRGDSKVSTWVYRIAVNTALKFNGKSFQNLKLVVDRDVQNLQALFDDDETEKAQQFETDLDVLQKLMNQLSVIDNLLMSLVLEDLSMREIADVVGLTEPNVRVKIHRIKEQLREQFKEMNVMR